MLIQINETYRITSDANNFIVEERKISGEKAKVEGEVRWVQISFHVTLLQACEYVLRRTVALSEVCELTDLMNELRSASKTIAEAVKEANLVGVSV